MAPLVVILIPLLNAILSFQAGAPDLQLINELPKLLSLIGGAAIAPISVGIGTAAAFASSYDSAVYELRTANYVDMVWAGLATNLALALLFHLGLAIFSKARPADLGWPNSFKQFVGDLRIGGAACLAALVPVYAVQLLLVQILEPETTHPLIESYVRNPSTALAIAAGVSAVLAAPLFEETVFRVMFQGWLEKCEDALLGRAPYHGELSSRSATSEAIPAESCRIDAERQFSILDDLSEPDAVVRTWDEPSAESEPSPPRRSRQHGWTPIVVSGVVFGLAHLGHGVAPASLIVLGLVLGYVYQRTHRIVPCIVCHMLFNAFSLCMLWMNVHAAG